MAVYGQQITKSFVSGCDFRNYQYTFVKTGSVAGEITGMGTINASTIGVLQNDPNVTEEALVCVFGLTKIYAETQDSASPLLAGGYVKCASSGKAVGTVPLASASINVQGVSLEAVASGSGTLVEMLYAPQLMLPNV